MTKTDNRNSRQLPDGEDSWERALALLTKADTHRTQGQFRQSAAACDEAIELGQMLDLTVAEFRKVLARAYRKKAVAPHAAWHAGGV